DLATDHERLPMHMETALFRVLQESLTNVHRHSRATKVHIHFSRQVEQIILDVRDDGCGIPAERLNQLREASAETGVGLAGMRERMNELNGNFELESDEHGTTIRATVPLSAIFPENSRETGQEARLPQTSRDVCSSQVGAGS